jgi:hypothetical protein
VIQGLEGPVRNSNLCGMGDRSASALCGAWELGADRCECLIGGTRQRIEVPDTEWMRGDDGDAFDLDLGVVVVV